MNGLPAIRFGDLDLALERVLARLYADATPQQLALAALASWAVGQGHSCLRLGLLDAVALEGDPRAAMLVGADLATIARSAPFVGRADDESPLILVGDRLYLRRYLRYEKTIARELGARAAELPDATLSESTLAGLVRMFPGVAEHDAQRHAAGEAVRRRLLVVLGGPGTGKTHTVARVLALWLAQAGDAPLRVALAAPTGKAATRLHEAVRATLASLPEGATLAERLPKNATTLQRLLGFRPLALDALIVDEASMVDLPLFARVLEALPRSARLVIVGDPDQLPAVENGAVLATLASLGPAPGPIAAGKVERGLAANVVRLDRQHRFGPDSALARLLDAVRDGDAPAARAALESRDVALHWLASPRGLDEPEAFAAARAGFAGLAAATTPAAALAELPRFRVLAALREGGHGTAGLNARLGLALLGTRNLAPPPPRMPVLVEANDPTSGLFNGDVGVCLADDAGNPQVWFEPADAPRAFPLASLPRHVPAYALTVHKAQGSEFDEVVLVLPPAPHPLLTRAWLYTALSRARQRLVVVGPWPVIETAIASDVRRMSGLGDLLRSARGPAALTES